MDDASSVPPAPMPPQNPPAGEPMPGDPGQDAGSIPAGDGMLDPNMGGSEDVPPMDAPEDGGAADKISQIYSELSPEHQKAVESYAESMRDQETANEEPTDDAAVGDDMGMGEEMPPQGDMNGAPAGAPMMETFIFKKGQIQKLNEEFQVTEPEDEKPEMEKKKENKLSKKSPFRAPKFK